MTIKSLVSVIIPTYNDSKNLKESITSCLKQTYPKIEILVCDDGSTDETSKVIKEFAKNNSFVIKYFILPHTGSPAKARNKGIMEASGEYITFLDSDDLMTDDRIIKQVKFLDKNKQVDVLCGNALKFTEREKLGPYFKNLQNKKIIFPSLVESNIIIQSTVMMRSSLSIADFQFPEKNLIHEDYGYWLKISAMERKIYYNSEIFAEYRVNPIGISQKLTPLRNIQKSINTFKWLIKENNIDNDKKTIIKKKIKKLRKIKIKIKIKNIIKLFNK